MYNSPLESEQIVLSLRDFVKTMLDLIIAHLCQLIFFRALHELVNITWYRKRSEYHSRKSCPRPCSQVSIRYISKHPTKCNSKNLSLLMY